MEQKQIMDIESRLAVVKGEGTGGRMDREGWCAQSLTGLSD